MLPNNREAQAVQAKVKSLGIHDVELFYDYQVKLWAVCQVKKTNTKVVTFENTRGTKIEPLVMWWVRTNEGNYRIPGEQDIHDIVATVRRAQIAFDKGGDWLEEKMLKVEEDKKLLHEIKQDERIKQYAKPLKKYIKKELG
jgi:hypothetical protein